MKFAVFTDDGLPSAFFDPAIHGDNIPAGAVEITDEQWLEFISNTGLRRWLDGNVVEYLPPVVEPQPAPITKRQLRLTLVRNGIALSAVEEAISAMPDGLEKEEAQIEWADANTFSRDHPTLLFIAAALGLTDAQVDTMWAEAVMA